jgi:hypothetical protein
MYMYDSTSIPVRPRTAPRGAAGTLPEDYGCQNHEICTKTYRNLRENTAKYPEHTRVEDYRDTRVHEMQMRQRTDRNIES